MKIKNLKLKLLTTPAKGWSASGGNYQLLTTSILYSLFFILYSYTFIVSPVFAQERQNPPGDLGTIRGPGGFIPNLFSGFTAEKGVGGTLERILSSLLGVFTIIGGLMFIVYFVLGALSWISAGGKTEQVQKSKDQMINAAIGIIIVVASYAIFYILGLVLGINILRPAETLEKLKP